MGTFAKRTSLAFFALLVGTSGANAWKEQTHRDHLTQWALDLVRLSDREGRYAPEIWDRYGFVTRIGAHDEDFPVSDAPYVRDQSLAELWRYGIRLNCRANNHYRHAISGHRLSDSPFVGLDDQDVDALTWAGTNPNFNEREEFQGGSQWSGMQGWSRADLDDGNMSWQAAVNRYGYTDSSRKLAYYTLGFVLHLLEDMGCPEHVHDDPHGASGFTGFEKYAYDHYAELRPDVERLVPRRFGKGPGDPGESYEDFFRNLGRIAYSAVRFDGGDPCNPRGSSDFAAMFVLKFDPFSWEWQLSNASGVPVLGDAMDRSFRWMDLAMAVRPLGHKGHDGGDWWPTWAETRGMEGTPPTDEKNYYYVELSGDTPQLLPWPPWYRWETRTLLPTAYLPTPLPQVADECRGPRWRREHLDGRTPLYQVVAQAVFPHVVSHAAGLIQHYYEIVNPPPYVKSVRVEQDGVAKYHAYWLDRRRVASGKTNVVEVEKRTREAMTDETFRPGRAVITVEFSEPVSSPVTQVGGALVTPMQPREKGRVWRGAFRIEDAAPTEKEERIEIATIDLNPHYAEEGSRIDADPGTPARRRMHGRSYTWEGYTPGVDTTHRIRVRREQRKAPTGGPGEVTFRCRRGVNLIRLVTGNGGPLVARRLPPDAHQHGEPDVEIVAHGKPHAPLRGTLTVSGPKIAEWNLYIWDPAATSRTRVRDRDGFLSKGGLRPGEYYSIRIFSDAPDAGGVVVFRVVYEDPGGG